MAPNSISLYIHIPFCIKKCHYCDFASFAANETVYDSYAAALCQEIAQTDNSKPITTIFIGGGTPTALPPFLLEKILAAVQERFTLVKNAEFTVEANPGTLSREKLGVLKAAGVNRLSMGLQSALEKELSILGRIHSFQDFLRNYADAVEMGFCNINVDIMFGLPEQGLADFEKTLEAVTGLPQPPSHISAYSLIVEEGTPFYNQPLRLPDEETERDMYSLAKNHLAKHGYAHYEISNFAKPGCECAHNLVYWDCGEYIGLGLGAHSYRNHIRYHNTLSMKQYLQQDYPCRREEAITIDKNSAISEFMFMGLRKIDGIREEEFTKRFGMKIDEIFAAPIQKHIKSGLLWRENGAIRLTERGLDVSNLVFGEFLL